MTGALPLKPADLESLALIGPGAGQTVAVGMTGEKAVGLPEREVGTLAALRQLAGSGAHIAYAVANDMDGTPVPASALSHDGAPGLERSGSTGNALAIDDEVNFTLAAGTALPANTTFKWTGTLQVARKRHLPPAPAAHGLLGPGSGSTTSPSPNPGSTGSTAK